MAFETLTTDASAGPLGSAGGSRSAAFGVLHRSAVTEPERFVSADEAAQFLAIKRRHLLVLVRNGITGAYPAGTGGKRNHWVFRLSELAAAITEKRTS